LSSGLPRFTYSLCLGVSGQTSGGILNFTCDSFRCTLDAIRQPFLLIPFLKQIANIRNEEKPRGNRQRSDLAVADPKPEN